jgi:ketosteroid isomerase-like protein
VQRRAVLAAGAWITPALVALTVVTVLLRPEAKRAEPAPDPRPAVNVASSTTADVVAEARALEETFVRLWNERSLDQLGSAFYAEDAVLVAANHEPIHGRAAIVEYLRDTRDTIGDIDRGAETWHVSASGNIVSLLGEYGARSGIRITAHEVYERRPDGSLRCTVDMFGFRDHLS